MPPFDPRYLEFRRRRFRPIPVRMLVPNVITLLAIFTGVPAPAGAITVLLPVYLAFLGLPQPPAMVTAFYTLLIAFLMVSRLPVFSGKSVRMRVPPELVLPVFVAVIIFVALLIGYPW